MTHKNVQKSLFIESKDASLKAVECISKHQSIGHLVSYLNCESLWLRHTQVLMHSLCSLTHYLHCSHAFLYLPYTHTSLGYLVLVHLIGANFKTNNYPIDYLDGNGTLWLYLVSFFTSNSFLLFVSLTALHYFVLLFAKSKLATLATFWLKKKLLFL